MGVAMMMILYCTVVGSIQSTVQYCMHAVFIIRCLLSAAVFRPSVSELRNLPKVDNLFDFPGSLNLTPNPLFLRAYCPLLLYVHFTCIRMM